MTQQIFQQIRLMSRWLAPLLLAGVCGCGNNAKITGKVSYQGYPVHYGSVIFLSADKTARSGVIERDGSYTVEDVPRGATKIGVISHNPAKGRSAARSRKAASAGKASPGSAGPAIEGWFPLPPKFESPETSGLGCTVESSHVGHDIEMK